MKTEALQLAEPLSTDRALSAQFDWRKIVKRAIDIVGASIGLVLFAPLFPIIALLVKLDSEGPAIIGLYRIGMYGKRFRMYKFRSMVNNAEKLERTCLTRSNAWVWITHLEGTTTASRDSVGC